MKFMDKFWIAKCAELFLEGYNHLGDINKGINQENSGFFGVNFAGKGFLQK